MHLISPFSCNVDKLLDWFDLRNRSCFVYSSVCYCCCCCCCVLKWNITKSTILSLLPHISNKNHFSWSSNVLPHAKTWANSNHSSYLVCCQLKFFWENSRDIHFYCLAAASESDSLKKEPCIWVVSLNKAVKFKCFISFGPFRLNDIDTNKNIIRHRINTLYINGLGYKFYSLLFFFSSCIPSLFILQYSFSVNIFTT